MTDIEFYKSCRNVGELMDYLEKFPRETPLSRKNCDGSYNHSTRFFYEDGRLLFGLEGRQVCKLHNKEEEEEDVLEFTNLFGLYSNYKGEDKLERIFKSVDEVQEEIDRRRKANDFTTYFIGSII